MEAKLTNEEIIKKIVEEFDKPRKEFNGLSYRTRKRDWLDKLLKIKPYLSKENLKKLSMKDAIYIYENTK